MSAPGAMEDPTQVTKESHSPAGTVDTSSLESVAADALTPGPVRDHVTPRLAQLACWAPPAVCSALQAVSERRVRLPPSEDAGGAGQRADGGR